MLEKSISIDFKDSDMDLVHTELSTQEDTINELDLVHWENKITRTIDWHLMPLICIFYFMDYLDRANMGNASLAGIRDDLSLTPKQFSLAVSAFYITYIIFEVPSNVILKRTDAVKWLSFIMFAWGLTTLLMAFVTNFSGLFACRLFLGATESGFIPGILYLLSKAYKPNQMTWRVALFVSMSSLSGVVSGPIAYATSFLDGKLNSWQYLFIIEGAPTIFLSVISYFYLFDDVCQVPWLTDKQKAIHKAYMETKETNVHVSAKTVVKACLDWKTVLFSLTYILSATGLAGFGFPVLTSQLLSAPPNVLQGFAVLLGGYLTDRLKNKRGIVMATGFFISAVGFLLLRVLENRWAKYCSLFIMPLGLGLQNAANISWSAINFPILEVRAVAVAVVVMVGNVGGVIASYLYPLDDAPDYAFGNSFNLVASLVGGGVSLLTSYLLYKQNCKLDLQNSVEYEKEEETTTQFRYYY